MIGNDLDTSHFKKKLKNICLIEKLFLTLHYNKNTNQTRLAKKYCGVEQR